MPDIQRLGMPMELGLELCALVGLRYPRLSVVQSLSSGFNTQPAPAPRAGLSNDYFHVTPKGRQQTQEALNRIFPEVPPKKSGHVGNRWSLGALPSNVMILR